MRILCWDKPEKRRSTKSHNDMHQADGAPPGTYVPNMSEEDRLKWKAILIKRGDDPRVEIRKTAIGTDRRNSKYCTYCQMLLVVRPDGSVVLSGNGKADVSASELVGAIREAQKALL